MPSSNISLGGLSIIDRGQPRSNMASQMARTAAQQEIRKRIESGQLRVEDEVSIKREWKDIYRQEYYKYYAVLLHQEQPSERIVTKVVQNPAATKFYARHAAISFSRYNTLLMVDSKRVSENVLDFPIEDDSISLETKEAFLVDWPGPLDRPGDQHIKRKTTEYIEKMWQHDSQRKIRYHAESSDDQRKVILRLLIEFLHRNGSLDAASITRLLLKSDLTEIHKDEGNRRPLETLQKYLLLGKRSEAIKYAKTRKLWDHAQCLAFLDKYQPPNTSKYTKDKNVLKEDSIVQLNNEYISSIDSEILNIVYRSLLNRILQSDPESVHIVKPPDVGNKAYEFVILSANDCEMEFDQSNQIFKLVNAIKRAPSISVLSDCHLISLGFPFVDTDDTMEDMSYRSNISFKQDDTYASRTLTISNIDMLILNEVWEYCLNLVRGTTDPANYDYIANLIPFKLVFASTLLDFGLHSMFACYLASIRNALAKLKLQPHIERDQFYDWDTIERSAELLSNVWDVYSKRSEFALHQHGAESYEFTTMAALMGASDVIGSALPPPAFDTPFQHPHAKEVANQQQLFSSDHNNSNQGPEPDYASMSSHGQGESAFDTPFQHPHATEGANQQQLFNSDHNNRNHGAAPDYMDFSTKHSFVPPPTIEEEPMTSSSLKESVMAEMTDSFNAFSPIRDEVELRSGDRSKATDESQQPGFIANFADSVRAFLPKSNSKQMILPPEKPPGEKIYWDEDRGEYVDPTKPNGEVDDYNEPPPVAAPIKTAPPSYSFAYKSAIDRYPRKPFPGA